MAWLVLPLEDTKSVTLMPPHVVTRWMDPSGLMPDEMDLRMPMPMTVATSGSAQRKAVDMTTFPLTNAPSGVMTSHFPGNRYIDHRCERNE
jgi:hypothetical protein